MGPGLPETGSRKPEHNLPASRTQRAKASALKPQQQLQPPPSPYNWIALTLEAIAPSQRWVLEVGYEARACGAAELGPLQIRKGVGLKQLFDKDGCM